MKRSLSQFETLAQRLIEGSFSRLFGGQLRPLEVAMRLARTLEDSQVDGRAANHFYVYLHPYDYDSVYRQNPALASELAGYVTHLAQQAGLSLPAPPQVELAADANVSRQQVRVRAEHELRREDPTTQVQRLDSLEEEALSALRALDAYLIIEGQRHIPLDRPFTSLGRRTDNDVVLDSATVSRQHAQIRWRYGHFVLYDLSNRGRTLVNGQPVSEYVLRPGDVITLSNVMIIYGEGVTRPRRPRPAGDDGGDETQMRPPT